MTPAGIEQATFGFVAQHLNHCATAVPYQSYIEWIKHTSYGVDWIGMASGGSGVGMLEGCAVVTGPVKGVEYFVVTVVVVKVLLFEFIIFNFTYITNI